MNIRNMLLILIASLFVSATNAKLNIEIKNEYQKPIIIGVAGICNDCIQLYPGNPPIKIKDIKDADNVMRIAPTQPNETIQNARSKFTQSNDWDKKIYIKEMGSNIPHKSIQKELANLKTSPYKTSTTQHATALITILDTNNPFFFDYDTTITPLRPLPTPPK